MAQVLHPALDRFDLAFQPAQLPLTASASSTVSRLVHEAAHAIGRGFEVAQPRVQVDVFLGHVLTGGGQALHFHGHGRDGVERALEAFGRNADGDGAALGVLVGLEDIAADHPAAIALGQGGNAGQGVIRVADDNADVAGADDQPF